MDFSYKLVCMCEHQLSNHGPTPTPQKVHGCKAISNAFLCDLQSSGGVVNNRGRQRSVCVHGYVVIFLF